MIVRITKILIIACMSIMLIVPYAYTFSSNGPTIIVLSILICFMCIIVAIMLFGAVGATLYQSILFAMLYSGSLYVLIFFIMAAPMQRQWRELGIEQDFQIVEPAEIAIFFAYALAIFYISMTLYRHRRLK